MQQPFYKLPLDFSRFFNEEGGKLEHCSELESIDQYLGLLITTCPGEHAFDEKFGTKIWDLDFENVVSKSKWEEEFVGYIKEAVERHEKRLTDVSVRIDVRDVLREDAYFETVTIRKRVDIYISGALLQSNERSNFGYVLYLGPLSNE